MKVSPAFSPFNSILINDYNSQNHTKISNENPQKFWDKRKFQIKNRNVPGRADLNLSSHTFTSISMIRTKMNFFFGERRLNLLTLSQQSLAQEQITRACYVLPLKFLL